MLDCIVLQMFVSSGFALRDNRDNRGSLGMEVIAIMTANWVTRFTRAQRQLIDEELASERHEPSTNQTRSFLIKISSKLMASQTHNTCCIAKTSCASVPVRSMDKRWELHAMPNALHPILLRFAVIAWQLYRSGLLISYFLLLDYTLEARACM